MPNTRLEAIRVNLQERGATMVGHSMNQRRIGRIVEGERKVLGEKKGDRPQNRRKRRFDLALETVAFGGLDSPDIDEAFDEVISDLPYFETSVDRVRSGKRRGVTHKIAFVRMDGRYLGEPSEGLFPLDSDAQDYSNVISIESRLDADEAATEDDINRRIGEQHERVRELSHQGKLNPENSPEYFDYALKHIDEMFTQRK